MSGKPIKKSKRKLNILQKQNTSNLGKPFNGSNWIMEYNALNFEPFFGPYYKDQAYYQQVFLLHTSLGVILFSHGTLKSIVNIFAI